MSNSVGFIKALDIVQIENSNYNIATKTLPDTEKVLRKKLLNRW